MTMRRRWRPEETVGLVLGLLLVALAFWAMYAYANTRREDFRDACETSGGHVYTRPAYKHAVDLCISSDGRIIDPTQEGAP